MSRKPALIEWQQAHAARPQDLADRHVLVIPADMAPMVLRCTRAYRADSSASGARDG